MSTFTDLEDRVQSLEDNQQENADSLSQYQDEVQQTVEEIQNQQQTDEESLGQLTFPLSQETIDLINECIDNHLGTPNQYSETKTFTNSDNGTTYTVNAGFKPKQVFAYAAFSVVSSTDIGISSGFAGVTSPTTGMDTSILIEPGSSGYAYSANNYLVGDANVNIVVTSWTSTGVVLTITVSPSSSSMKVNLILIG